MDIHGDAIITTQPRKGFRRSLAAFKRQVQKKISITMRPSITVLWKGIRKRCFKI